MRKMVMMAMAGLLAACGGGAGDDSGDKTTTGIPGVEGEDRQVLVDLKKRACTERLDLRPNFETERARRGCDCAIDRLVAGKSADEIMALMGNNQHRDLEEQTADQCLAEGQ